MGKEDLGVWVRVWVWLWVWVGSKRGEGVGDGEASRMRRELVMGSIHAYGCPSTCGCTSTHSHASTYGCTSPYRKHITLSEAHHPIDVPASPPPRALSARTRWRRVTWPSLPPGNSTEATSDAQRQRRSWTKARAAAAGAAAGRGRRWRRRGVWAGGQPVSVLEGAA